MFQVDNRIELAREKFYNQKSLKWKREINTWYKIHINQKKNNLKMNKVFFIKYGITTWRSFDTWI